MQGLSIAVQQLIKPFYSASSPPTTHEIWGKSTSVAYLLPQHIQHAEQCILTLGAPLVHDYPV